MEYSLFGCKVNKYYLNQRLNYFHNTKKGNERKNTHLIATCVVTDRAKSKWIKHTLTLLSKGKRVYLTGCGAFQKGNAMDTDAFFNIYPELRIHKGDLILLGESPPILIDGKREKILRDKNIYTRKFIVIQNGCDTHCTFCLTLSKRGKHRSRDTKDILEEINSFVIGGGKEIIITGVNLASWGASHTRKPGESKVSDLLEQIIEKTNIERIRISSLGPEFLDDKFFQLMENPRFLPHFHFSIQHFDDEILKSMNRNYDSKILNNVLTRIRQLDREDKDYISIGADIIVGFPGEDEQAFKTLLSAVKKYNITKLHAFPFSPHIKGESVPAGSFPDQIPGLIKQERMQQLLRVGDEIRNIFIEKNKQKSRPILLETKKIIDGKEIRTGRTPNYIQRTVVGKYERGQIVERGED